MPTKRLFSDHRFFLTQPINRDVFGCIYGQFRAVFEVLSLRERSVLIKTVGSGVKP